MKARFVVALVVVAGVALVPGVAAAKKATTCDLLTTKQVSTILGHKVVKTGLASEKSSGVKQCEYITGFYQKPRFKDLAAPYKLSVSTQPLTGVAAIVDQLAADSDARKVDSLGVRAFYTGSNYLIAVVGEVVIKVKVTNVEWQNNELDTLIRTPELAAMTIVVPLFQTAAK